MPSDSALIPVGGSRKQSMRVFGGTLLAVLLVAATPALAESSKAKPQKQNPAMLWSEFQLDPESGAAVPTVPRILQAKRTARTAIAPALASLSPLDETSGTSPWTLPLIVLVAFLLSATAWLGLIKVWRVPSRQSADRARPDNGGTVVPIGVSRSDGHQVPARRASGGIRYRE